MADKDYWARRFKLAEDKIKDDAFDYVKYLENQYDLAIHELNTKINAWYGRFADNNKVSIAEARKILTANELDEFKWSVKEYIEKGKVAGISGQWVKELENASARVHISRLESLKIDFRQKVEELTQKRLDTTKEVAELSYMESYGHTAFDFQKGIGLGFNFAGVNEYALKRALERSWAVDGKTFSTRIWEDKQQLVSVLDREITQIVSLGLSSQQAVERISKQFQTSKYNAGRLVMTESAAMSSMAQKDCFNDLDVEEYIVVETLDDSTCPLCGDMDGMVFKMSEFKVGITAPPFHPWCRGCTAPYFADMQGVGERFARDVNGEKFTVPKEMKYGEWKAKQEELYGKGFIDNTQKMRYNNSKDEEQYERYKNVLRDLAPTSYDDFLEIKYNSSEKWSDMKHQYRILNSYKIDSGDISAADMLKFDDIVITEKRTQFTSKYKNRGNIAGAYLDGKWDKLFIAHSSIDDSPKGYKGNNELVLLKNSRRFKYIDVIDGKGNTRDATWHDTEAKFFEYFADMYEQTPFTSITMLSERGMCDSCKGVMKQFKEQFPNVKVNVMSNKHVEGNVWKIRRRAK